MVTSTEEECDVSSLPQAIKPAAASELEGQSPNSSIIWSDEETKVYVMTVDGGKLSNEEKGQLSHNMQEACKGKSVRKIQEVGMSKEDHDTLKSGGVVPLRISEADLGIRRNIEAGSCKKAVRLLISDNSCTAILEKKTIKT